MSGLSCGVCSANRVHARYEIGRQTVVQCVDCGFMFFDSPTLGEDIRQCYTQPHFVNDPYFEHIRAEVEDSNHSIVLKDLRRLARTLHKFAGAPGTLLDVGCGTGHFLNYCKNLGWTTLGVEVNSLLAESARQMFGLSVDSRPLSDLHAEYRDSLDAVSFLDVLEHLPNPRLRLIEALRLLKPGGILMVAVPNVDALINLTADLLHRLVRRRAEPILSRLYTYPQHINYFSGATLMRLFRATGFQPSIVRQYSRSHEVAHLPLPARWSAGALLTLGRMVGRGNKLLLLGRKQHAHSDTPSGANF